MGTMSNILGRKIKNIKDNINAYTTGEVRMVRGYIVEATGLDNVAYYEKVIVGDENVGYVESITVDSIMIALATHNAKISVGDKVISTGAQFSGKFSDSSLGHIIDIFGEDKLTGKYFDNLMTVQIETEPISIMDRATVNRPMLTGIMGIDLMYPIGKGQRQLIVGDKKTGKTQIALDAILNQIEQGTICIYVSIGKTKKEVKNIYGQLLRRGAMQYTTIVAAFNDDGAPVLKATPYTALSIARRYMEQGKDVLVVIDDLKRHADVCREMALLMDKTPGRDAYPPDIFYTHSRMLELGCQHKDGGSITILPICETKSGDITDYISTNIISITDGQIVLSAKNFEKGQKPAINYGLSVSRLGGAVQSAEMKKSGPAIRRELLAYLEQKEVFELANIDEIGETIKNRMIKGARIIESLNQHKFAVKTTQEMLYTIDDLNRGE